MGRMGLHRLQLTVQPIICAADDGSGPAAARIGPDCLAAFREWGVDALWLPAKEWRCTAARDGLNNLDELMERARELGLYSSDSTVAHVFFIRAVDGHTGPLGRGMLGGNIAFVAQDGERQGDAPTDARDAFIIAHELGHCLGLGHVVDELGEFNNDAVPNLMGEGAFADRVGAEGLVRYQANVVRSSPMAVATARL